jgi:calcium channel MID1
MQPFTLGPLQSRMLATTIAAYLLLTSHTSTRPFIFAYAAENGAAPELSHNSHPVVPLDLPEETTSTEDGHQERNGGYVPEFAYFARSLLGRQAEEVGKLKNDEKLEIDIDPDTTVFFILEKVQLPTKRDDIVHSQAPDASGADTVKARYTENEEDKLLVSRQTQRQVWISANTCRQPMPKGGKSPEGGPQLVLYASTSAENQKPGPASTKNLVTNSTGILFDKGFVSLEVNTTSDVYIGISAPKLDEDWFGSWHFEIAASAEGSFHSHNKTDPFLFMVDTDSESTLFITYNLTNSDKEEDVDQWRKTNPFSMYAFPAGERSPVTGMENSVCALQQKFDKSNNLTVETVITTKFGSGFPKSQFDVHGLDNNQQYNGYLVVNGNQETLSLPGVGRVRGGGRVFKQFTWTTKVGG